MAKVGRPYNIKTAKEMQKRIDEYFKKCEGEPLLGDDGLPMFDKFGREIRIGAEPPTITGLALAVGLKSRQALLNYQGREEFNYTIERAKLRVENYAEKRLFDKDGSSGAQFSLRNNFKGWKEDINDNNEALEKLDEVLGMIGGAGNEAQGVQR